MNNQFNKGDIIKEYLEQFPQTPHLTLARMIYKENKEVFTNAENVRSIIRHHTGNSGERGRKHLKDRRFIREFTKDSFNPFSLPESDEKEFEPFLIPKAQNNILVMGDIHVPYHNIPAITAAMQYGLDQKVNTILLNGDIIDFHQLSQFIKDPRKRHFPEELDALKALLRSIRDAFPEAVIYYKQGNHSERLENYLKVKAPELYGMQEFELDVLAGFGALGIQYIKDKRTVKAGKLNIYHGHELKGGLIQPVNPARGLFLRTNTNALASHFHRSSEHIDPNANGEIIGCWSIGCLCELHPEYMPNNKWNHGAAIVRVKKSGDFSVTSFKIDKGKLLV